MHNSHSCEASFHSLEGELVFKIKRTESGEGTVGYSIKVDKGDVRIYYDIYGVKEELAHAVAGETLEGRGGYVEEGKTVYIVIEAAEGSRGKVKVELNK